MALTQNRHQRPEAAWHSWWDRAIVVGSYVPALLWGVAFANIVRGVPNPQPSQPAEPVHWFPHRSQGIDDQQRDPGGTIARALPSQS